MDAILDAGDNPHAIEVEECLAHLTSSREGLTSHEAARRLAIDGPNTLAAQSGRPAVLRFMLHFHNALIYVLLASAAVTAFLGHWIDTGVILAVVVVNAIVGFVQEGRAESAMAAVRSMLAPRATALRDGRRVTVPSADLVAGDVVLLEAGDKVPADLRLVAARALRVQEAVLTGESVPVDKRIAPVASDALLGDRSSMAFSGTEVVGGIGRGIVVATAGRTQIGRISGMLGDVARLTTPLVAQMDRFARWLSVMILLVSAVLLLFGYFVGHLPFGEIFMTVVGLTVAAIPEGLPAVLTITLAIGVQAMARRHVIVRKLPAIETLGAVSVICTDKTGTLTRNEMTVASVAFASGRHTVSGDGYAPRGDITPAAPEAELAQMALVASLCNDAALHNSGGNWGIEGDPMEGALLAFAGKAGVDLDGWRRIDEIPFDAAHRYMAVLVEDRDGARRILVKGAPERLLPMCARQAGPSGPESIGPEHWDAEADAIASEGQRVLALAAMPTRDDALNEAAFDGKLTLVGLVGLIDPPRPEAIAAVAECRQAGIGIKMITGDHVGTASAIGRAIGLENPDRVLSGAEVERLEDAALQTEAGKVNIFARTSPEHKLRLVTLLQAQGLTVAMTGDGVNDAPALKRADAGVAMGVKGSEAAKEAADLVLTDDNFASMVAAVREGRTVFDNLRKVISWTLPTNAGEAATIMAALLLGLTLPISPVQILWVNLVTASTLGLALAFEPTEPGTMLRPPRPRTAPLLTAELLWHVLFVGALFAAAVFGLFAYATDRGYPLELAQTMTMNLLVILEIFHLFFIRNIYGTSLTFAAVRGTRAVWTCLAVIVTAQFAVTYLPLAQAVMGTRAVPIVDGVLMIGIGVVFFAIIEVEKQLKLSLRGRGSH
ncbi:putative cation-transporting ATPase F [Defluviimonas aquaemixtae]|uniref:Putative cation-transporting ATPase F n=1 Tax=Albidovulum aquaemixtae TaxID=1542388 RepID=A0A2R8B682_9RHOB|nr:cation-transporting P-type ATPase [Defluviimonas aquaemixtae]SPH18119.1 putative cation-transporting ATPase F [Defluviimonas aquaemixtae]